MKTLSRFVIKFTNLIRVTRGSDSKDSIRYLMLICIVCRLAYLIGHGDQASAVRSGPRSRIVSTQ